VARLFAFIAGRPVLVLVLAAILAVLCAGFFDGPHRLVK
jgi:hypothetical protein